MNCDILACSVKGNSTGKHIPGYYKKLFSVFNAYINVFSDSVAYLLISEEFVISARTFFFNKQSKKIFILLVNSTLFKKKKNNDMVHMFFRQ